MNKIINSFAKLGEYILENDDELQAAIGKSVFNNQWFTHESQQLALKAIANEMLNPEKLEHWLSSYDLAKNDAFQGKISKKVGVIMAGNLPLVGFHDFLCVLAAGHSAFVKLSDKDPYLLPLLAQKLIAIDGYFAEKIHFVEQIRDIDAIIATGSNNTSRYFEQYFAKYPNIIRKSRTSVAVLNGTETEEELHLLGIDVFRYFGLGCRNVSKIYVPRSYNFDLLLEKLHDFNYLVMHNKFKNNFDYNFTLVILNGKPHLSNGCVIMIEDEQLHSRIAMLHYEFYDEINDVAEKMKTQAIDLQCIVSKENIGDLIVTPFGKTQQPTLFDYADGVDTMAFLG